MRNLASPALLLSLLLLTACGFQLRGTGQAALDLPALVVSAANQYGDLTQALGSSLEAAGTEVVAEGSAPRLTILGERRDKRPLTSSGSVNAADFQLRLEVTFSLEDAAGQLLLSDGAVIAERTFAFDSNSFAASTDEEERLFEELYQDAARQILLQLQARLRSGVPQ